MECKIFLSVLARRMTTYLLSNKYIDISVQKGVVPGESGCVEHTSVLSQIIRDARENKGYLAVLWLDLANAYGSIPHKESIQCVHVFFGQPSYTGHEEIF